jgi:hypothetical protein
MQPTVRQNVGCKSLKNDSEDQATFQDGQESLRQQSLSSCPIIVKPSGSLTLDAVQNVHIRSLGSGRLGMTCWSNQARS